MSRARLLIRGLKTAARFVSNKGARKAAKAVNKTPRLTAKPVAPKPAAQSKRAVNLGNIQRGPKRFTPGERAKAVQRANRRSKSAGHFEGRQNNAIGIQGTRSSAQLHDGTKTHDIAFGHSDQKMRARGLKDDYASRREFGDTPKSKGHTKLRREGTKDMMGKLLDVDQFDTVTNSPTSKGRAALYSRATKGAIGNPKGAFHTSQSVRVGPDMWINQSTGGKRAKFNPKHMGKGLQRMTESKATRVGKPAGGSSAKLAEIGKPKNVILDSKADRAATRAKISKAQKNKKAIQKAKAAKAEAIRQEATNPSTRRGRSVQGRQGVVRSTRRSGVSGEQRRAAQTSTRAARARTSSNRNARNELRPPQIARAGRARGAYRQADPATRSRVGSRVLSDKATETRRINRSTGTSTGGARTRTRAAASSARSGTDVRSRTGVVRSNQRSRVSPRQLQRTRAMNQFDGMPPARSAEDRRAIRNFESQDPNTRSRGGRRTWDGTHETRRIRRKRR